MPDKYIELRRLRRKWRRVWWGQLSERQKQQYITTRGGRLKSDRPKRRYKTLYGEEKHSQQEGV